MPWTIIKRWRFLRASTGVNPMGLSPHWRSGFIARFYARASLLAHASVLPQACLSGSGASQRAIQQAMRWALPDPLSRSELHSKLFGKLLLPPPYPPPSLPPPFVSVTSSYFLSESSAIICASERESSSEAILSSSWKLLFSNTFRPLGDGKEN